MLFCIVVKTAILENMRYPPHRAVIILCGRDRIREAFNEISPWTEGGALVSNMLLAAYCV